MNKIRITKETREALLKAIVLITNNCSHPHQNVLGQFPRNVGGKERCLLCNKTRTQLGHGGPWREWKAE